MNAKQNFHRATMVLTLFFLGASFPADAADTQKVQTLRTPDNGIQPQAVVDSLGVAHLIYYKGDNMAGDVFYVRRHPRDETFSKPIQVNSRPKSAMAAGTIRGAQLAVGKNGRAHVAWNGHAPRKGAWMEAPMLYTRLNDAGTAFEPERDVITTARGLDGGGSVAADERGNVYVFWHAPKPGTTNGEAGRAVFMARSADDGRTFAPETLTTDRPTGACGCCGMKAWADNRGNLFALYRAASEKVNRAETLLISRDGGASFEIAFTHPWKIPTCPMSSAFFSETKDGLLSAWETDSKVYFARIGLQALDVSVPQTPPGIGRQRYPVVVGNAVGETLVVWAEGGRTSSDRTVAWQLYSKDGRPSESSRAEGVPANSMAAAFVKPNGQFAIIY